MAVLRTPAAWPPTESPPRQRKDRGPWAPRRRTPYGSSSETIPGRGWIPYPVQDTANSLGNLLLVDLATGQVLLLDDLDDLSGELFQDLVPFASLLPGSGSSVAISAARQAASGRRAGQICSVEMCPCLTFFSWTESSEACLSGNATSINRLSLIAI